MGSGARRAARSALVVAVLVGPPAALVLWGRWPLDGGDAVGGGIATVVAWGVWGQFAFGLVRPLADDPLRRLGRQLLGDRPATATGPTPVVRLAEILAQVKVLVRVMGEVDAVRPAESSSHGIVWEVPARQKALEALAYMALSDRGQTRQELERVLGAESAKAVFTTIETVLKLVDDRPRLEDGRHLVLSEGVVSDYGIFCDLVARAGRADDAEALLGDALGLVRGEPFSGITRSYTWAAPFRDEMVTRVVDAAEQLAELRLRRGDGAGAQAAARRGLLVSPLEPRMTRLIARAEETL